MRKYLIPSDLTKEQAREIGIPEKLRKSGKKMIVQLTYSTVPKDIKGWVDSSRFLPQTFDMCHLLLDGDRKKKGWWTGANWFGFRLKDEEKVIAWRRDEEMSDYARKETV